ncbi:hypothetical protein FKL07_19945 [Citrobacter freundii]|nr:hypothetical protein [Citrobacter freundii]
MIAFLISSAIDGSEPALCRCHIPTIDTPSAATTSSLVITMPVEILNSICSPRDEIATRMQISTRP